MPSCSFLLAPYSSQTCRAAPSCPQPSPKYLNTHFFFWLLSPLHSSLRREALQGNVILPLPYCRLRAPIDCKHRPGVSLAWSMRPEKEPNSSSILWSSHSIDLSEYLHLLYPHCSFISQSCSSHVYFVCPWEASPCPGLLLTSQNIAG